MVLAKSIARVMFDIWSGQAVSNNCHKLPGPEQQEALPLSYTDREVPRRELYKLKKLLPANKAHHL